MKKENKNLEDMTKKEIEDAIESLEKKDGILKKREHFIYKLVIGAGITILATMIVGMSIMFKFAWDHGNIVKETGYYQAKEESIKTEQTLLEEKLYNKEISPEEYIQLKKNVEGISEHEYFNTVAPEEERKSWQDNQDKITKSVTHTVGTGFGGMGVCFAGLMTEVGFYAARNINKSKRDILEEEWKRRKSKELYEKHSKALLEIEPKEM